MMPYANELPLGKALFCDSRGNPVTIDLNEEDHDVIAYLQDAEEEPMLRDVA